MNFARHQAVGAHAFVTVTVVGLMAAAAALAQTSALEDPFDGGRMLADVKAYGDFGNHRTGTPGDVATRKWLVSRFEALRLKVELEPFSVNQFLLDAAHVVVAGKTYEAVPYWHPHPTGSTPVDGAMVIVDGKGDPSLARGKVGVMTTEAGTVEALPRLVSAFAKQGALGLILSRGELDAPIMENARPPFVDQPTPIPVVLVSGVAGQALRAAAAGAATAALSITGTEVAGIQAANVIATLVRDPSFPFIVVSTPYSGWNVNIGERGPGLAILLALADRAVHTPARVNYAFVVNSGHELNYMGADISIASGRLPPPARTRVWVHLGAGIGVVKHTLQNGTWVADLTEIRTNISGKATYEAEIRKAFGGLPETSFNFGSAPGEVDNVIDKGYDVFGLIGGGRPFPFTHTRLDLMGSVAPGHLSAIGQAAGAVLAAIEAK